jgi:hypothetical protein
MSIVSFFRLICRGDVEKTETGLSFCSLTLEEKESLLGIGMGLQHKISKCMSVSTGLTVYAMVLNLGTLV